MKPTRCTPSSATIIDHFLTNDVADIFQSTILTTNISDHFPVIATINFSKTKNVPPVRQKRIFSTDNFQKFNEAFHSINWNFLSTFENVNEQFCHFSDVFNTLYNL
jgi:hypothetical protein